MRFPGLLWVWAIGAGVYWLPRLAPGAPWLPAALVVVGAVLKWLEVCGDPFEPLEPPEVLPRDVRRVWRWLFG